jgi:transposase
MKQSNLAKSISDAAWSQFLFCLRYKAENAGGASIEVRAAYTSQTCPACSCLVQKTLDIRVHHCPDCGYVASRDVAAAQVVELRGLAGTLPGRKVNPTSNVAEWVARSSPLKGGEDVTNGNIALRFASFAIDSCWHANRPLLRFKQATAP